MQLILRKEPSLRPGQRVHRLLDEMSEQYRSRVYTDRPDYADFDSQAKFQAIISIIAKRLREHPKELLKNNLCRWRRINLHVQGGGMRRTGRTPIDDNAVHGDLDKPNAQVIYQQFLRQSVHTLEVPTAIS